MPRPIPVLLVVASVLSIFAPAPGSAAQVDRYVVPVRFHIVTDLKMDKGRLTMTDWVTADDIEQTILPEVNRIWRPAGIKFSLESIHRTPTLEPPNSDRLIAGIVNAKRDSQGKSDPKRIKRLEKLVDWQLHDPELINVYLVPYLGETSQGNARRKARRIFVTQWSDKASKAASPPTRFQLVETRPFKKGSLSRTLAHEIGHILGLKHPDKSTQVVFGQLMGGRKAGYTLTPEHVDTARHHAAEITRTF